MTLAGQLAQVAPAHLTDLGPNSSANIDRCITAGTAVPHLTLPRIDLCVGFAWRWPKAFQHEGEQRVRVVKGEVCARAHRY